MLVPRVIDPKVSVDTVTNMFRFADEKAQVEELFKERIQIVNASLFKKTTDRGNILSTGKAGRGSGRSNNRTPGRPVSLPTSFDENVHIFHSLRSTESEDVCSTNAKPFSRSEDANDK
jgi:hypothetical protein